MKKDKKAPLLHGDKKNEQQIKNQDYPGEPNSKPNKPKKPSKDNPKKVPESNDPAGYSENKRYKESPYGEEE